MRVEKFAVAADMCWPKKSENVDWNDQNWLKTTFKQVPPKPKFWAEN